MPPHSGLVIAFLALLVLAGFYKLVDPVPTSGALRAAGLPASMHLVRLLGIFEIVVGVAGVVWGGAVVSLIAAGLYAGFLVFVVEALRRRLPISSCGCLGAADTPPTVAHVVVNSGAVLTLLLGFVSPIGPLGGIHSLPIAEGVAFTLFLSATVYLLQGILTVLPMREAQRRTTSLPIQSHPRSPRD